jgi:hypothetical protein
MQLVSEICQTTVWHPIDVANTMHESVQIPALSRGVHRSKKPKANKTRMVVGYCIHYLNTLYRLANFVAHVSVKVLP